MALKVVFFFNIDSLLLAAQTGKNQERWEGDFFLSASLSLASFLILAPEYATQNRINLQAMAGYRPRRRADQSQPQVARVWLLVISHPAAMYSRCSGIQLVTLLHVILSEFFLSSFFLSSFFLILSTLTAQLNKHKELECDECTACYVHGFYWGKDRNIVDLILDGLLV